MDIYNDKTLYRILAGTVLLFSMMGSTMAYLAGHQAVSIRSMDYNYDPVFPAIVLLTVARKLKIASSNNAFSKSASGSMDFYTYRNFLGPDGFFNGYPGL